MGRVVPGALVALLGALSAGAAVLGLTTAPAGPATRRAEPSLEALHRPSAERVSAAACTALAQGRPFALTRGGAVEAVDSTTASVAGTLATGAAPDGGVAFDRRAKRIFVTARGPDGLPAVWSIGCAGPAALAVGDAELPAVSPRGGRLAYVALDGEGRQAGVGIVALGRRGRPAKPKELLPAGSVPPPNPIRALALGHHGSALAVWGGFVNPVLGPHRLTTGTLDPERARSLRALRPVITLESISIASGPAPKAWQTAAVYLPNGELVVGADGASLTMPFSTAHRGGFRSVVPNTGKVVSLGAGPAGALVWVTAGGRLEGAVRAWDFPFGPQASTPPFTPPSVRTMPGHFTAVTWSAGTGSQATTPPPAFSPVRLPSVVGLSEPKAVRELDRLAVPSWVAKTVTDPSVPPDTVVAQDPPAGVEEACQCAVNLTVSSGGTPVTASRR